MKNIYSLQFQYFSLPHGKTIWLRSRPSDLDQKKSIASILPWEWLGGYPQLKLYLMPLMQAIPHHLVRDYKTNSSSFIYIIHLRFPFSSCSIFFLIFQKFQILAPRESSCKANCSSSLFFFKILCLRRLSISF